MGRGNGDTYLCGSGGGKRDHGRIYGTAFRGTAGRPIGRTAEYRSGGCIRVRESAGIWSAQCDDCGRPGRSENPAGQRGVYHGMALCNPVGVYMESPIGGAGGRRRRCGGKGE